jgi:hypothetical protein
VGDVWIPAPCFRRDRFRRNDRLGVGVRSPDLTRHRVGDPTAVKGLQAFDGFGAGELAEIERGNAARMFPKCSG